MISVVVCTYNRKLLLREMLLSFFSQDGLDQVEYELIVVDNQSTDGTCSVVEPFSDYPIRYIFEENQGLSYSRNRGIRESRGDITAFLDDDVLVDKRWLIELAACFEQSSADVVGGRTYLIFRSDPPSWLRGSFRINLSEVDWGDQRKEMKDSCSLFGLNLSFRKSLFEKHGFFNEDVGRRGSELLSGEETFLLDKILCSGGRVVYEPKAVVGHIIESHRLRWDYFKQLAICEGRSQAIMERHRNRFVRFLRVIRSFQKITFAYFRLICLRCFGGSEYIIKDGTRRVFILRSMLAERWRRAFNEEGYEKR